MKYNLLIADAHPVFRRGLYFELSALEIFDFIYEAENGGEVIDRCRTSIVDLILLDINMPKLDGLSAARELLTRNKRRTPKIIVLTAYTDPRLVYNLLDIGIHGYVSKTSSAADIIEAIRFVVKNRVYCPPEFDIKIRDLVFAKKVPTITLSDNEKEFIKMIAEGYTNKDIASFYNASLRTIETRRNRLEKKLQVRNSAHLIDYAYKTGVLTVG